MIRSLQHARILITRQSDQSHSLSAQIRALDGEPIAVPLFEIQSLVTEQWCSAVNSKLATCDLAIIISKNAAQLCLPQLTPALCSKVHWACVGPATAAYIAQHDIKASYPAAPPYDTAALMAMLVKTSPDLKNANILIFTGVAGNPELQQQLLAMGATVEIIEVYKRIQAHLAFIDLPHIFNANAGLDIIIITCVTSLQYLRAFIHAHALDLAMPLLVVSTRIAKTALEMGFINVYTSKSVAEADIISSLIEWREANGGKYN